MLDRRPSRVRAAALVAVSLLALIVAVVGFQTSPAWNYVTEDDVLPPFVRPGVAVVIPADDVPERIFGVPLLRVQEGLPDLRLWNSILPAAHDLRNEVLDGAWQASWISPDAKVRVQVAAVRRRATTGVIFGRKCVPEKKVVWPAPTVNAGFAFKGERAAGFCALAVTERTELYVTALTSRVAIVPTLATRVQELLGTMVQAVPSAVGPDKKRFPTPAASAFINRALLGATIGIPLLWALPTLLTDRATWQRLRWLLSLRWLRRRRAPGIDVDPWVRLRLWRVVTLACLQFCVAVWTLRAAAALHWGTVRTGALVMGSVLALSSAPRLIHLRQRRVSQVFAGRRRAFSVLALVLGLAVVGLALAVMFAAISFGALGQGSGAPADYLQQRTNLVVELLAVPLTLLAILPLMVVRRLAMRSLRTEAVKDTRAEILLLRSFADDKRRLRSRASERRSLIDRVGLRRWERFEEVVAVSLARFGPVLAVGQVGERLPPALGAVRRQYSNEEWQDRVAETMSDASSLCVTVGRSDALSWEIRRIVEFGHLHKTIFVLPPTGRREHLRRLAVLGSALQIPWSELDVRRSGEWVLAVIVPQPGQRPVLLRGRAQEDLAYDVALDACADAIYGTWYPRSIGAPVDDRPGPNPEVYPPGATPVYRPLLRRGVVWIPLALSSSSLVTLLFTFVLGEAPDARSTIHLTNAFKFDAVSVDRADGAAYAIVNGRYVQALDFAGKTLRAVTEADNAQELVAAEGTLFMASPLRGTVTAYDVRAKKVLWTLKDLPGVRSLVVADHRLALVVPSTGEVRSVDVTTGSTEASTHLSGVPWAAASDGKSLYVTLFQTHTLARLDLSNLSRTASFETAASPDQVVTLGPMVWVYSAVEHTLRTVIGPEATVLTQSQFPIIRSNGTTMAIEGVERVTLVSLDGRLTRTRLSTREADVLLVTPSGDLVTGHAGQVSLSAHVSEPS